ncbi:helix-turn-helix domain-containing protein [Nocardia cyriacigeorgica]|uniref:Helix-turn-helix domain-containing protein n=1 Tax=Nocardia cyriacigeorgica TaxID=135487 RepID=A0A5R8NRR6_9NOCA|nr:helix-turn-helix transcriptional regulator [Nocardia cyriacigeorgica]TLF78382.1 helix-turn-helix domain-containing protein [Nocardia cyriacigeorgica]
MKETTSTLPRRELGRQLREAREGMGMSLEQAAEVMEMSPSSLQRLETGQVTRIRVVVVRELCEIYGLNDELTAALVGLAMQTADESWWHEFGDVIPSSFSVYVVLEAAATTLVSYQPDVVPGLLQTAEYARALIRSAFPESTPPEQEHRAQLKVRRQALITRRRSPITLNVILHECVLRRMVGGPRVMSKQLMALADASTRPNVTIRVIPFSAGMPTGDQIGPFVILDFAKNRRGISTEPTTVYAETYTGDFYSEKASIVQRYRQAYAVLERAALDEINSRTLLRRVAKECTL